MRFIDLTSRRFGKLTVINRLPNYMWTTPKHEGQMSRFLVRCDCAKEKAVLGQSLRYGKTKSCGCESLKMLALGRNGHPTHGHCRNAKLTRTYRSWSAARQRARIRGIKFDSRWNSFDQFLRDMGQRPVHGILRRIDSPKGYIYRNCLWSHTPKWNLILRRRERNRKQRRRSSESKDKDAEAKVIKLGRSRKCTYCSTPLNSLNRTVDHVVALRNGGKHSANNLVAACRSCNCRKRTMPVDEFIKSRLR